MLEAVLSGRARFGGRAALRSWLTAVLKNKIVDVLRRTSHHDALDDEGGEDAGHAVACPRPRPDEIAEQRQALARALAGIDRLPPTLRDAMRLRVVEDRSTESVCAELGISEENLFVRVHRARAEAARSLHCLRSAGAATPILRRATAEEGESMPAWSLRRAPDARPRRFVGAASSRERHAGRSAAQVRRSQIIAAGSMSSLEKRVTLRGTRCALEPGFRPSRSRSASHSGRGISTST